MLTHCGSTQVILILTQSYRRFLLLHFALLLRELGLQSLHFLRSFGHFVITWVLAASCVTCVRYNGLEKKVCRGHCERLVFVMRLMGNRVAREDHGRKMEKTLGEISWDITSGQGHQNTPVKPSICLQVPLR